MASAKHVLFIVADQWRGDCLGFLGHPAVKTPHLDALARRGTSFARHFGQGAPCGPGRASLLTGLYVMNHRVTANGVPLDARHPTLPMELRRAGWDPCLIGYTTTVPDPRTTAPDDIRFREWGEAMEGWRVIAHFDENQWRNYFSWVRAKGVTWTGAPKSLLEPADGPPGPTAGPSRMPEAVSDTAWTAEKTIAFLREADPDRPFLLHCGFFRPHPPFAAPVPWHESVPLDRIPPAAGARTLAEEAAQHPLMAHWLATQDRGSYYQGASGTVAPMSAEELAQTRRAYYGLIAEADDAIGQVLAVLEETGLARDTLIVFTADHGEQLGDHGLLGKLGWFDQSYHLPLIVADPANPVAHGRRVEAFTEAVDVMTTILDCLGIAVPRAHDGVSLMPWLRGETPSAWRDAVHFEYDARGGWPDPTRSPLGLGVDESVLCAMRTEDWKYVHFPTLPPVLYDLRRDPMETRNVASDPGHAEMLTTAVSAMLTWRMLNAERTLTDLCTTPHGLVDRRLGRAVTAASPLR